MKNISKDVGYVFACFFLRFSQLHKIQNDVIFVCFASFVNLLCCPEMFFCERKYFKMSMMRGAALRHIVCPFCILLLQVA